MTFRDDIVETDTAQFGAKKDGKKRTFAGRMQVMESRLNKGWSVVALNDKNTHGKRGAGGAESTSEVLPALRRSLQRETIVAADGSAAFKSAASKMEKIHLKGVSHLTKIFTPTVKLWKGSLPSSQAKTLQIHAKRRHSLVKETKRCFFVAGGDNKAESRFGAIKGNLRRMNNVGRFVASSRKKRVQVLAAARLHRCPGLFEVLTALKEYRVACSEGYAKVSPSNAFQPDALDWLEPQEENAS